MAGGKTAAKARKKPTSDAELRAVQAWVAEGLRSSDASSVARLVAAKWEGSSSTRPALLGGLYLLLKKGGTTPTGVVLKQLHQLTDRALQEWKEASKTAPGQKQSVVLAWAAFKGLATVTEGSQLAEEEQQELREKLVIGLHSLVQEADPQLWVEQWQPPVDFPAAADDDAAARGTPQQLVAHLGADLVQTYLNAKVRLKQGGSIEADKAVYKLTQALRALAVSMHGRYDCCCALSLVSRAVVCGA
jgi:hypothetical protein